MHANNFKSLIKEEFVKRFEQTVLAEIKEYQKRQSDNDDKFTLIFNRLDAIQKQQTEIISLLNNTKDECKKEFISESDDLFNKFELHRRHVNEEVVSIKCVSREISKKIDEKIGRDEYLDELDNVQCKINNCSLNLEKDKCILNESIFEVKKDISKTIRDIKTDFLKVIDDIQNQLDILSKSLDIYKVDSVGILRELQIYKKSVFIIEKKIENIYTLIERIR